ncbi:biotin transporter BioY [Patescibacteria group bacterium]|nr:biotin transporter BioY [Patescibacteria group bacterium]MBU4480938.1 biotin transporter BioY [Patescibacteria group bacterium]
MKSTNNEFITNLRIKQPVFIDTVLPLPSTKSLAKTRDIVLILSFGIITAICAKLKVEIGVVPITMQTLAVLLSGALLGAKRGALSQIAYLILGLAGLPWFARGGGMQYVFSPTFGYIVGFIFAAYLVGWLCERGFDRKIETAILAMLIGNVLIYIPGLLWLARFTGIGKVLAVGLYPFIFGDILKLLLAGFLLPSVWKIIKPEPKKI